MSDRRALGQRRLVAAAVVACVVAGVAVAVRWPDEVFWWGGLFRAAVVLAALWLALPTKDRPAAWANIKPATVVIAVAVLFLAVRLPKIGLPLVGILLLVRFVFGPLFDRRGRRDSR